MRTLSTFGLSLLLAASLIGTGCAEQKGKKPDKKEDKKEDKKDAEKDAQK